MRFPGTCKPVLKGASLRQLLADADSDQIYTVCDDLLLHDKHQKVPTAKQ